MKAEAQERRPLFLTPDDDPITTARAPVLMRAVLDRATRVPECMTAVESFIRNGSAQHDSITGHVVGDWLGAMQALLDAASDALRSEIESIPMKKWPRAQQLRNVMARRWEFDAKRRYLTGAHAPKYIAKKQASAHA